jgi:hypothetical protein
VIVGTNGDALADTALQRIEPALRIDEPTIATTRTAAAARTTVAAAIARNAVVCQRRAGR